MSSKCDSLHNQNRGCTGSYELLCAQHHNNVQNESIPVHESAVFIINQFFLVFLKKTRKTALDSIMIINALI